MEPRRDRIGTSAVANTTPHGAGALKIGIRGALKTGIAHAVRERRLGRIHCARDVLICWHRRWHRRQAVHTSLHGGVALKSGLAAGIVQLRVGNDGVRRVLGTATDRATDSLVRHRERRHRLHRARLGCGGSEGGGLHWRQSRSTRHVCARQGAIFSEIQDGVLHGPFFWYVGLLGDWPILIDRRAAD